MIGIFVVFIVAAAVSLTPPEPAPTAPQPEPVPVVIEKTVVIECLPLGQGERLVRDLTIPFQQRRYLNSKGDGCRKKSETSTASSPPATNHARKEQP